MLMMCRTLPVVALLWLLAPGVALTQGGSISREEALSGAFPGAVIEAEQVFLTKEQMSRIGELARVDVESGLIARYVATKGGEVEGRAYVDTHIVRTKRESLLISLTADGAVKRIDVTAFLEPSEYRANGRWLRQYDNRNVEFFCQPLQRARNGGQFLVPILKPSTSLHELDVVDHDYVQAVF